MTLVRSAWTVPDFRRIWGANLISGLGAEIGELALPALAVITLGATATEASWVRAAVMAPFLLLTLWLGVVVDRKRRRPLMVLADVGRGMVLVVLCALALTDVLTIPLLVVAAFALGGMTVLQQLADFSFLPHIVSEEQLVDANAKITATQSALSVAGAGAGGALVQAVTAPFALVVNAVGYLASAVLISRVDVTEPTPHVQRDRSMVREAWAGLHLLLRHRVLRALVTEASIWNFGNEIFILALTVHVLGSVDNGPLALGVILTGVGVGAFVGSLLTSRLTARLGYGRGLLLSLIAGNSAPLVGVLIVASTEVWLVPVLCAAFVVSGVGIGIANGQATAVRQIATEPEIRGRVNAGYRLLSWGALPIGALLGGMLASQLGTWPAAAIGTALCAVATIPVALSPVVRIRDLQDIAPGRLAPVE